MPAGTTVAHTHRRLIQYKTDMPTYVVERAKTGLCNLVYGVVQHDSQQVAAGFRGGGSLEMGHQSPYSPKL